MRQLAATSLNALPTRRCPMGPCGSTGKLPTGRVDGPPLSTAATAERRRCNPRCASCSNRCRKLALVSPACRRPSYFLLLVQEKSSQREAHPGYAPSGHPVLRVPCAARFGRAGKQLGHPWPQTVCLFPARLSAARRSTGAPRARASCPLARRSLLRFLRRSKSSEAHHECTRSPRVSG